MQNNFLQLRRCRRIPVQETKTVLKTTDKSLALSAENIEKLLDKLLPLLDGGRTRDQVLQSLPAELRQGAEELLRLFAKEDFFETAAEPDKQLGQQRIVLISTGRLGERLARHLRDSGAKQVEELSAADAAGETLETLCDKLSQADMAAVCTDLPCPDICELVNKAALTVKLPWLLAQADGRDGWVGPLFIPYETGCYNCLLQRLLSCSFHPETDKAIHAAALRQPFTERLELLPPFTDLLAATAALEIIRHLTALSPPLTYKAQILIDCISGISRRDVLHRLPRCPACSHIGEQVSCIQPFAG
jgi:ribosomal protein S12 methylthiotransferase accessory factor